MKRRALILTCGVMMVCGACHRKDPGIGHFIPQEELILSSPTSYELEPLGVMDPLYLKVGDSLLAIVENSGEPLVKILDWDGRSLAAWGRIGKGPGEFLQIMSVELFPFGRGDMQAGLYDGSRKRYVSVPCRADSVDGQIRPLWSCEKNFDQVVRLSDNQYIGTAVNDSNRFYLLDREGEIRSKAPIFPPRPDGIPLLSHSMACTGTLVGSPRDSLVAGSVAYDGGIDVYVIRGGQIRSAWRFTQFDMDYDILPGYNNVPTPNRNSRQGYVSLCFSNNYLYALYSGRNMQDDDSDMCDEIHVFDYRGKHCKRYKTDRKLYELGVDTDDHHLFGLTRDAEGNAQLVDYTL